MGYLDGNVEQITSKYLTYGVEHSGEVILTNQPQNQKFSFKRVCLLNTKGNINSVFDVRDPIKISLEYEVTQNFNGLEVSIKVINSSGIPIFTVDRSFHLSSELVIGSYLAEIEIPSLFLAPGFYSIDVAAHIPNVEILSLYQSLISFEVEETGSRMAQYKGCAIGVVLVDFPWKELAVNFK